MTFKPKYSVGDVVIRTNGTLPLKVTRVPFNQWHYYTAIYVRSGHSFTFFEDQVRPYEKDQKTSQTMQTLYSFVKPDGTISYATLLATDSLNRSIVEEKGTNAVFPIDPSLLTEVLPYTFEVSFSGKVETFLGSPGALEVGDLVVKQDSSIMGRVTAIDTKNKTTRKYFKGFRISMEPVDCSQVASSPDNGLDFN